MKKILIMTGIILLIIIIAGGVLLYLNKGGITNFAMEKIITGIEQRALRDIPAKYQTDELKKLLIQAKDKVYEKGLSDPQVKDLLKTFQEAYQDQKLDSLELEIIIDRLKRISK